MKKNLLLILLFPFLIVCAECKVLTYENIVSKIYDLPALAVLPVKGEKGALASSYDRKSKYNEKSDSYIDWYANADWAGVVRQEGENVVLAEIDGPGVIWRIWSASLGDGKVKIYLDGKLAVDILWKDYFSRKIAPFNRKGLVYKTAGGWNNYTPISFQKSCKIVAKATIEQSKKFEMDPGIWGKFFHFNYTVFPKNTKVQTFTMKLSSNENRALDKANRIMTTYLGNNPIPIKNIKKEVVNWTIPAGKSKSLIITGKRAITSLKARIPKNSNYNDLLRQLTLSINWDDEKSPSVWSPIGDFFGTAPGINEYKSLVMGMVDSSSLRPEASKGVRCQVSGKTEDRVKVSGVRCQDSPPLLKGVRGISKNKDQSTKDKSNPIIHKSNNAFEFYSYWYMPFEKCAKITIKNESDKPQKISLIVIHTPLKSSFDNLGYFHAKWHRDLETDKKQPLDWKIMETSGRGRFVGTMLHIWNPKGKWWGEGDEKFYVDGEKFPSTLGTGSEDYFGYAWCSPEIFSSAYHSQTTNSHNRGHVSNNRWHIGDNIPFQKSFDAYIEKYFINSRPTLYAGIAYWYLSKNGIDNLKEIPVKDRLGYYTGLKIFKEKNALEAEKLPVANISNGKTKTQSMVNFGNEWSEDNQLWWTEAGIDDFIELQIDSPENSEKKLSVQLTKAPNYAKIQFYFNGKKVGNEIDGFSQHVAASGNINIGKVKLIKGKNKLKIKITGANPNAKKSYMVGLDYVKLD